VLDQTADPNEPPCRAYQSTNFMKEMKQFKTGGKFKKIYLEIVDQLIDHLKSQEAGDSSARKLAKR
jgi:hypothetical protein